MRDEELERLIADDESWLEFLKNEIPKLEAYFQWNKEQLMRESDPYKQRLIKDHMDIVKADIKAFKQAVASKDK